MKKNITTIIMSLAVIVVWGVVFYNLLSPSNKSSVEQIASNAPTPKNENKQTKLRLNYRNPFRTGDVKNKNNKDVHPVKVQAEPPLFNFKGLIKGTKNRVVIIEQKGIREVITIKNNLLGFKITSINNDSIVLRKKGIRYSLIKN